MLQMQKFSLNVLQVSLSVQLDLEKQVVTS